MRLFACLAFVLALSLPAAAEPYNRSLYRH